MGESVQMGDLSLCRSLVYLGTSARDLGRRDEENLMAATLTGESLGKLTEFLSELAELTEVTGVVVGAHGSFDVKLDGEDLTIDNQGTAEAPLYVLRLSS